MSVSASPPTPRRISRNSFGSVHGMTLAEAGRLLASPRTRQVVTLASGKVGVCEVGDPNGSPVVWLTGSMGPAISAVLYDGIARRHRLRLICIDRPGYNNTMFTPGLPLVFEFVDIINEVTLFLKIPQFSLAAFSLGAVYGFAFSLWYPERLRGPMHMVSPWLSTSVPGASSTLKSIARYAPGFLIRTTLYTVPTLGQWFDNVWGTIASLGSGNGAAAAKDKQQRSLQSKEEPLQYSDKSSLPPGREYIYDQVYENALWNLQSGKPGPQNDWIVALEREPWGFKYEEITYPTRLFLGGQDEQVPLSAWKYMSERMQSVDVTVVDNGQHYPRLDFVEELFGLVSKTVHAL